MTCCCKNSYVWKYIKRFKCICFTKPLSKQTDPTTVEKKDLEPNIVPIEIIETLSDVSYPSPKTNTPTNINNNSNSENKSDINTDVDNTEKITDKNEKENTTVVKQGIQLHSGQIVPQKPTIKVRELSNFVDKDYLRNSRDWDNNSPLKLPLNYGTNATYKTEVTEQIVNDINDEYDPHKLSSRSSLSDSDESYSECIEPPLK